jgi:hypothetical protein
MKSKVSYYILVVIIILSGGFLSTASTPNGDANGPLLEVVLVVIVVFLILVLAVSRIWKYGEPEEN